MSELESRVRDNVIQLRESYGWRQSEMARRCGMSKQRLSKLETGYQRMHVDDLETFAAVLDVPVTFLLAPRP